MEITKIVEYINIELKKYNTASVNKIISKMGEKQSTIKGRLRKEVIQEYNKSKPIIEVKPVELKPNAVIEVKQKLFKVDIGVLDKWYEFVKNHKEFKVQKDYLMILSPD